MDEKPGFLTELKRRNVFRVAATYGVVGWIVVEVSSTVLPTFDAPRWILQVLTFVVILGFPLALVLAWAFELTPDGVKRDADVDRSQARAPTGRRSLLIIFAALAVGALWFLALDRFVEADRDDIDPAPEGERSVAVLPFENISGDAANDPFTIGIHDDLLTNISQIRSIKTISRTSVLQYRETTKTIPEIARELGVAAILEGGVQRSGNRIRINVQLIDAASDKHLWAETYDRELTAAGVFAIQSEIATSIADSLRVTLSAEEHERLDSAPTQSLAAFETYFRGKQLLEERTRESLYQAVEYFDEVVALDPDFALAHSGLADAYFLLPEYVADIDVAREARGKSEAAANRALAIDPSLPEALTSVGWNRLIHYYDWKGAEANLRRALTIQPNNTGALHWLSHILSWQGEHEEAIELARRAVEVDPFSRLMSMNLSYILMDAGDMDASIAIARENIRQYPDAVEQYGNLWLTYLRAGRASEAAGICVTWAERTGRDAEAAKVVGEAFVRYAETGETQASPNAVVDRVEFGLEDLGQVYAFVGDAERALDALELGYEERSGSRSVLSMRLNEGYDFIRDQPRFIELMARVGLAP